LFCKRTFTQLLVFSFHQQHEDQRYQNPIDNFANAE
jgi:hypothetical protein